MCGEHYRSPHAACVAVSERGWVLPGASSCTVCRCVRSHSSAHICLHGSLGISLVDWSIVSHNPMFCRWDVQTPSMPLCPFFPLPLYRQTGKQTIILWTHYSAWSSYHNQPSRVSNLGSAKLCSVCTMWLFVSVLLGVLSFSFFFRRRCEGGKSKEKETDRARERGLRERLSAHICTPVSGDTPPIWK